MTTSTKRKRRTISFDVKKFIIESKKSVPELVIEFNLPYTTIDGSIKNKDKIQRAIEDGIGGKRAKIGPVKNSELEEALLKWLKDIRSENVAVDGPILKEKALKLAELLGITDFKANEGWLSESRIVMESNVSLCNDPKYLQMCDQLEDFFEQERTKKSVQTSITQFSQ